MTGRREDSFDSQLWDIERGQIEALAIDLYKQFYTSMVSVPGDAVDRFIPWYRLTLEARADYRKAALDALRESLP